MIGRELIGINKLSNLMDISSIITSDEGKKLKNIVNDINSKFGN